MEWRGKERGERGEGKRKKMRGEGERERRMRKRGERAEKSEERGKEEKYSKKKYEKSEEEREKRQEWGRLFHAWHVRLMGRSCTLANVDCVVMQSSGWSSWLAFICLSAIVNLIRSLPWLSGPGGGGRGARATVGISVHTHTHSEISIQIHIHTYRRPSSWKISEAKTVSYN